MEALPAEMLAAGLPVRIAASEQHQHLVFLHAVAFAHLDGLYRGVGRRLDDVLHLHGFQDKQRVALFHRLALGDGQRQDEARHGRLQVFDQPGAALPHAHLLKQLVEAVAHRNLVAGAVDLEGKRLGGEVRLDHLGLVRLVVVDHVEAVLVKADHVGGERFPVEQQPVGRFFGIHPDGVVDCYFQHVAWLDWEL